MREFDLYDRVKLIPFDKLTFWFTGTVRIDPLFHADAPGGLQ